MRRIRIHWGWLPAAVFMGAVGWVRYGPAATVLLVLAGLTLGLYVERRAQRRDAKTRQPRD